MAYSPILILDIANKDIEEFKTYKIMKNNGLETLSLKPKQNHGQSKSNPIPITHII